MRVVTIADRTLKIVDEMTLMHDAWLIKKIRAAGLHDIVVDPSRTPTEIADAVLDRLEEADAGLTILCGCLLPEYMEPKDWTPAVAEELLAWIGGIAAREDKIVVRGLMAETFLHFFRNGLAHMRISRTSSERRGPIAAILMPSPPIGGTLDAGDWSDLVRALGEWNPDRYPSVLRWTVREALLALEERMRAAAREDYRDELLHYHILVAQAGSKKVKAPKVPAILRGR